jgi:hypothetical protein
MTSQNQYVMTKSLIWQEDVIIYIHHVHTVLTKIYKENIDRIKILIHCHIVQIRKI